MKLQTLILTVIIGLVISVLSLPISAAEMPAGPYLSTTGNAIVDAAPDSATIVVEVSYSAKDASTAKRQVDKRVAQYYDFLLKNSIEKKDISAANLSTQAEYDYHKNNERKQIGYRAVRQIQIIVRYLDKLNRLLDEALKLGLNEI